ncbi:hypothetical protein D0894_06495 [Pseudomonas monteilii]|uniref:Uncharacterized protein n=1 Tax=Pseudomonas monteilii TaxID=76759 RepID=A0A399MBZ3_9PSED|nr:hypothetical protein D0894_06495 [Pseudomonas monteilii]
MAKHLCGCHWPLRGRARSHRDPTGLSPDAILVGAGKPAKRPVQAAENQQICDNRPTFRMPIMKKQGHLHH